MHTLLKITFFLMDLETFRLYHFEAYEYRVSEKLPNKFKVLSNKIAHEGLNTPKFDKMSLDAPLCPIG